MSIGKKIKSLRNNKGLTQRQLSKVINYSPSYIGDLENNRTNPSIKTLEAMAQYFEVEITYFFEKKCCYMKFINGEKNFCHSMEAGCKTCPIRKDKVY